MVVTLLYTLLARSKMIVPVVTGEDAPVIPGVTIAAKDITTTKADCWTAAGKDVGSAGEKGEEREGGLQKRFFLNFSTSWPPESSLGPFQAAAMVITIGAA